MNTPFITKNAFPNPEHMLACSSVQCLLFVQIDNLEDFEDIPDRVSDVLVNAGFIRQLTKALKSGAMMSLMIHFLISSRKAEMDQFAQGLGPVLKGAQENPSICKPLFVHNDDNAKITPEKFKALLDESNVEEETLKDYFHDYIDSKGKSMLNTLGMWNDKKVDKEKHKWECLQKHNPRDN